MPVVQVKRGFLVGVAAPRMATLDGLLELLGIAEKHHVLGGGAGRRFRPLQRWMMGLCGVANLDKGVRTSRATSFVWEDVESAANRTVKAPPKRGKSRA